MLTVVRMAVAAVLPVSPDEAYYWVWSRYLQGGYLDHPPMVALWIRLGTLLWPGALGVRCLAPLSAALGSVVLYRTAEDLFPRRQAGIAAAALLNATLLLNAGAVIQTPDTPLLFFWTAALWAMGRVVVRFRAHRSTTGWWLVAGFFIGLGGVSKYTAALFPLAIGVWLLCVPKMRGQLRGYGPFLAALMALAVFMPVLVWNAHHEWAGVLKQGARAGDWHPARAAQFWGELLAGQIGLATPGVALVLVLGVVRAARRWREDEAAALVASLVIVPLAVFAQHALGDRVQANWPGVIYPAACLAAGAFVMRWRWAMVMGLAISLMVFMQAIWVPFPLSRKLDPTLARLGGWPELSQAVAGISGCQAHFVAADEYGLASELAFYNPGTTPIWGVEHRWRFTSLPVAQAVPGQTGIVIYSQHHSETPDPALWAQISPVGQVTRARFGIGAEAYRLYCVTGQAALSSTAVILPSGAESNAYSHP